MALYFSDSFDLGLSKWSAAGAVTYDPTGGVYGGGAMRIGPSATDGANNVRRTFIPQNNGITSNPVTRFSFWLKTDGVATASEKTIIWIYNVYDPWADQGPINIRTDGKLLFYDWDNAGWTGIYAPLNYSRLDDGNWHHIQFGIKYATAGYLSLQIDGEDIILLPSWNFLAGGIGTPIVLDSVVFHNMNGPAYWIDDLIIWNDIDSGDGFVGIQPPTKIFTFRPTADTVQADSIPSSGTDRYLLINEPTLNTANYVTLSVGGKDLYEMENIANVSNIILGIQATIQYGTTLPGYKSNVRPILVSNNVTYNGNTSLSITTAAKESTVRVFKDFGNSNVSWTEATLNALKIGFENTG